MAAPGAGGARGAIGPVPRDHAGGSETRRCRGSHFSPRASTEAAAPPRHRRDGATIRAEPGAGLGTHYPTVWSRRLLRSPGHWRFRGRWSGPTRDPALIGRGLLHTLVAVGDTPVVAFVRLRGAMDSATRPARRSSSAETLRGRYLAHCALQARARGRDGSEPALAGRMIRCYLPGPSSRSSQRSIMSFSYRIG